MGPEHQIKLHVELGPMVGMDVGGERLGEIIPGI